MNYENIDEKFWIRLAELFFLDTELLDQAFVSLAADPKASKHKREQIQNFLVQCIAPHASANLGFLYYPVIGEWAGFDEKDLAKKVRRSMDLRKKYPKWFFMLSDLWCLKMLRQLSVDRLLDRL